MPILRLWCGAALAACVLAATGSVAWTFDDKKPDKKAEEKSPVDLDRSALDIDAGLARAIERVGKPGDTLKADPAKKRDDGKVYAKVAPAVVLLRDRLGSGTGFFISPDGWIITNHHVVEHSEFDPKTGERTMNVNVGKLVDGDMEVDKTPLKAKVYLWSPRADLALLKLTSLPKGMQEVPYLKIAKTAPPTTTPCYLIGHPGVGTLWSFRDGKITGKGNYPADLTKELAPTLEAAGADKGKLDVLLAAKKRMRFLASSSGTTGGDSGSPVVNKAGEVIAVHFAGIGSGQGSNRISYHVHVAELQDFLRYFDLKAERKKAPIFFPSMVPPHTFFLLTEPKDEAQPYSLTFLSRNGDRLEVAARWFNLKRKINVKPGATNRDKANSFNPDLAIVFAPGVIYTYYARLGKTWDLLLIRSAKDNQLPSLNDPPDRAVARSFENGSWSDWKMVDAKTYKSMLVPSAFDDKDCKDRLQAYLNSLSKPK